MKSGGNIAEADGKRKKKKSPKKRGLPEVIENIKSFQKIGLNK